MDEDHPLNWRKKAFWNRATAIFTLAWIGFVVIYTDGDQTHALSGYIFLVPLGAWGLVFGLSRLLGGKQSGSDRVQ